MLIVNKLFALVAMFFGIYFVGMLVLTWLPEKIRHKIFEQNKLLNLLYGKMFRTPEEKLLAEGGSGAIPGLSDPSDSDEG